jgi:signal transduction histidine kinase
MQFLFNSITKKLFISFGFLLLNIFIITVFALSFLWKSNSAEAIKSSIDKQRILVMQLLKTDLDFLRFETVNSIYFLKGESSILKKRDSLYSVFHRNHAVLLIDMQNEDFSFGREIVQIDSLFDAYNANFNKVVLLINNRGFKDFGLEGKMRTYAHELENVKSIPLTDLLMLRRHEKDFLLRKESQYVQKFNVLADEVMFRLHKAGNSQDANLLSRYYNAFNQLTDLNYTFGIHPKDGLQGVLNRQSEEISMALGGLSALTTNQKEIILRRNAIIFIGISLISIILSTVLTYYTSIRLARPITRLSGSMGKFMINEGLNEKDLYNEDADEISHLSQSFIKLIRKLRAQFGEIIQQNKELKKLNDELDRFIYSAAHDLKSPLSSLEGLIHLAEKEIGTDKNSHYFKMMGSSVNKLHGFIRDITDYARNKRQVLRVEKIKVSDTIHDIIASLLFLPGAENLNISVNIQNDEVCTDRARLEIVLKNLLSNSFRYIDLNKSVSYIKIEGMVDADALRISVTDNGIGIGKEHLGKIFDMFYRAVETSQGTGIGLFLVKESVKMLRGKISVKSNLGEWTTFYLSIPNQQHGIIASPETEAVVLEEVL